MSRLFGLLCLVDADRPFAQGVREWIESVGAVRSLRFYVTQIELGPGDRTNVRVRYRNRAAGSRKSFTIGWDSGDRFG